MKGLEGSVRLGPEPRHVKVYCFGNTSNGELGFGGIDEDNILIPRKQKSLHLNRKSYTVRQISCGKNHTLILLTTRTIAKGEKGVAEDTAIGTSSLVLSCGSNERKQLGREGSWKRLEPVNGLLSHLFVQIACGSHHNLLLTEAGQVFSFGCNLYGQLGLRNNKDEAVEKPCLVKKLAADTVIQVSCGDYHSFALTNNGSLYTWGSNACGQLGHGRKGNCENSPIQVYDLRCVPIRCVAGGGGHSVAVSYTGALYVWGKNEFGQLGLGDTQDRMVPTIQVSLRNQRTVYVSCGDEHTAALTREGGLFTWGAGMYGQLGHGKNGNEILPRKVIELMGSTVTQLSCGRCHTLVVVGSKSRLYSFGLNGSGQLGTGSQASKNAPIKVDGPWVEFTKEMCTKAMSGPLIEVVDKSPEKERMVDDLTEENVNKLKAENREFEVIDISDTSSPTSSRMAIDEIRVEEDDEEEEVEESDQEMKEDTFGEAKARRKLSVPLIEEPDEESQTHFKRTDTVEIIEYYSDPDSDCEDHPAHFRMLGGCIPGVPVRRHHLRLLAAVASRGDQSYALATNLTDDVILSEKIEPCLENEAIALFDNSMFENWVKISEAEAIPLGAIEYIETAFGSVSCWNASYINDDCDYVEVLPRIKWDAVHRGFDILHRLQNKRILSIVAEVVARLIPELPRHFGDVGNLDPEILRVYILLPQFPLFYSWPSHENDDILMNLVIPYVSAVFELNQTCRAVLGYWFRGLEPKKFKALVEVYKSCVVHVIKNEEFETKAAAEYIRFKDLSAFRHANDIINHKLQTIVGQSLQFLSFLNNVNDNSNIISYQDFYIKELSSRSVIEMDYVYYKLRSHRNFKGITYFCDYPFTLDPGAKMVVLELDSKMKQTEAMRQVIVPTTTGLGYAIVQDFLILDIDRNNLVASTINQLCRIKDHSEYKKKLRINFIGEEAIDAGTGIKKEFFLLLMNNVLSPGYGMFKEYKETNSIWFDIAMVEFIEDYSMFDMIGIICGLAIYNNNILYLPFPLPLYKKLLGEPLGLEDLESLDPILVKTLKEILETTYSEEAFNAIYGDINFVITLMQFDKPVEQELCSGGKDKYLRFHNREEYVHLYWNYTLNVAVDRQFTIFKSGFRKVVDEDVIKLFNAEELQTMIIGQSDYSWELLEQEAVYKEPFGPKHPTIVKFWRVFHSLSLEEKKKFLLFLTGSDRIPILGMKDVQLMFQSMKVSDDHLPVAHTCFNLLDLPEEYSSEDILKEKLLKAIDNTQGFSLA